MQARNTKLVPTSTIIDLSLNKNDKSFTFLFIYLLSI